MWQLVMHFWHYWTKPAVLVCLPSYHVEHITALSRYLRAVSYYGVLPWLACRTAWRLALNQEGSASTLTRASWHVVCMFLQCLRCFSQDTGTKHAHWIHLNIFFYLSISMDAGWPLYAAITCNLSSVLPAFTLRYVASPPGPPATLSAAVFIVTAKFDLDNKNQIYLVFPKWKKWEKISIHRVIILVIANDFYLVIVSFSQKKIQVTLTMMKLFSSTKWILEFRTSSGRK